MTQAPILNSAAPDRCDVRVSWVLTGANALYTSFDWIKYTETALPPAVVARTVGQMARAQAFENVQAELYRAKSAFTLPK